MFDVIKQLMMTSAVTQELHHHRKIDLLSSIKLMFQIRLGKIRQDKISDPLVYGAPARAGFIALLSNKYFK